jgi:thiol-disulfide isomerase/thioredoxin
MYIPFSPDCQKYITEFISFSQFLKKNKTEIILAKINVHDNRKFGKEYRVEEFPSIFFFDKNKNVFKFKEEKTEYNLIKFINKKLYGDVIEYNELSQINELVSNKKFKRNQIFVVSTFSGINNKNIFYKYAYENNREMFIFCISKQCYNEYNENIIIFKNFDERIQKYSDYYKNEDKLEIDKLKEFIIKNSIESGALLENEYFSLCNEYKRKMLIYFRDSESINDLKKDKIIKEVGFKLREKIGFSFVSDINSNEFNIKISEDFVIAKHELPTLLFVDKIDLKEKKFKTYRITNIDSQKIYFYNILI